MGADRLVLGMLCACAHVRRGAAVSKDLREGCVASVSLHALASGCCASVTISCLQGTCVRHTASPALTCSPRAKQDRRNADTLHAAHITRPAMLHNMRLPGHTSVCCMTACCVTHI